MRWPSSTCVIDVLMHYSIKIDCKHVNTLLARCAFMPKYVAIIDVFQTPCCSKFNLLDQSFSCFCCPSIGGNWTEPLASHYCPAIWNVRQRALLGSPTSTIISYNSNQCHRSQYPPALATFTHAVPIGLPQMAGTRVKVKANDASVGGEQGICVCRYPYVYSKDSNIL